MNLVQRVFSLVMVVFLLGMAMPALGWERSSPNVPPDSPWYRSLDKIVAWRLAHPPILGQRPYPRSEFARLTAEARKTFEESVRAEPGQSGENFAKYARRMARQRQIELVLDQLEEEFREELVDMGAVEGDKHAYRFHGFEKAILGVTLLDSPPVTIPVNNGRGQINAQIEPLLDYNLGRHNIYGVQTSIETVHRFTAGRFFSGFVQPRFEVNTPRQGDMSGTATVQNAYGTFRAGNFILEFGRDSMIWGFGEQGSLLFSPNPRPMDGVHITNPTPARLPWIFKYLGEWRYTLYGYNMGPGDAQKWAWLTGYKLSLMPAQYVELGFGHAVQIGGEGMPSPSFVDVMGEFFGFRPGGTDPNSPNITNHTFEGELLIRIPQLRGLQIYGNMAIEDYWKSIKKTLIQGCSYLGGIYLPALNGTGSMDLRAEFVRTNPLEYRHGLYVDGYTLNRRLIGADAGPDAMTLHFLFRHTLSKRLWYGVTLDFDHRSSNQYTELRNSDGTAGPVVMTQAGPTEKRYRGLFDIDYQFRGPVKLHVTAGYERALNFNFEQGRNRNNFLAAATVTLDFDRHFRFEVH